MELSMTEESGANFLGAIRQVRRLMTDVSKLLLEVDSLMGQEGWEPRAGSTATAGASYSISWPRNWIPFHVFRFYRNEDMQSAIACVSVLREADDRKIPLNEPHVSASIIEYETGTALPEGVQLYACANWHLYVPNRRDDGTLNFVEPRKLWPSESTAKRMTSFAVPLVKIRDQITLNETVVVPLLHALKNIQASTSGS
jgi:hypothetical protein